MEYFDFDLEIGEGLGQDYPLSARCQGSQSSVTLRFPFDELALQDQLKALHIAQIGSGGPPRRARSNEAQSIQTFGQRLFDALLAGDVRALYDGSRRDADQRGQGLRLKLHIKAPELAALPWEYLCDSRTGEYICLSPLTPLVRALDLDFAVPPLRMLPPLHILGVIASSSDLAPLDISGERQRIETALGNLERVGLVRLTWLPGQTWRDLRQAFLGGNDWHILHFIGHGGFDSTAREGVIALADDEGKSHFLTATQLGTLLAGYRSLRLVLLSTGKGARAAEYDLVSRTAVTMAWRRISAVLTIREEMTDRAALEFNRTFYAGLARGWPVDTAVTEARIAVHRDITDSLEWGVPVLALRAPAGVLFDFTVTPDEMVGQGNTYAQRGQFDQAVDAYEGAIRLDPTCVEAYRGQGLLLTILGRHRAAWAILERLKQIASDNEVLRQARLEAMQAIQASVPFGTLLATLGDHTSHVVAVAWSPDEQRLASASDDQTACVWDASNGRHLFTGLHAGFVSAIAWSPDGKRLASASQDQTVRVWDAESGQLLFTTSSHTDTVFAVAWSPDGTRLASASGDQTVRVWDVGGRKSLCHASGHTGAVRAVAWSPEDTRLASAGDDQTVRLWDAERFQPLATLSGHTAPVLAVAWSPDGRRLASASHDKTVRIWKV